MNRRDFFKGCASFAAAAAGRGFGITNLVFAPAAPAERPQAPPNAPPPNARDLLVLVFARGGLDGLNLVVPFNTSAADHRRYYNDLRPALHIPAPGDARAARRAVDLDGRFALHPDAARGIPEVDAGLPASGPGRKGAFDTGGLYRIFQDGDLAVVHAAGTPDVTGSHFDTELYVDLGGKALGSGWLARYLDAAGEPPDALAVAPQWSVPPSLLSPAGRSATAVPDADNFGPRWRSGGWVNQAARDAIAADQRALLEPMFLRGAASASFVESIGQGALGAYDALRDALTTAYAPSAAYLTDGDYVPDWGGLGESLQLIAQLAKSNLANPLRVACVDAGGGFDTHDGQGACGWASDGAGNPRFPRLIVNLATNLKAFHDDMSADPQWRGRFVVVVLSEFGRVLYQNSSSGTDHGAGNVMLVMGSGASHGAPNVNGGQVYADWPGLSRFGFNDGLAITTDYRVPLAELLWRRMGLTLDQVNQQVFPSLGVTAGQLLGLAVPRTQAGRPPQPVAASAPHRL